MQAWRQGGRLYTVQAHLAATDVRKYTRTASGSTLLQGVSTVACSALTALGSAWPPVALVGSAVRSRGSRAPPSALRPTARAETLAAALLLLAAVDQDAQHARLAAQCGRQVAPLDEEPLLEVGDVFLHQLYL